MSNDIIKEAKIVDSVIDEREQMEINNRRIDGRRLMRKSNN